jgi:hypothetical protein
MAHGANETNAARRVTVASYYFGNYHPGDPRNARNKGKDWSEWELVKAARPRFPGHQQPKVPLWGYGDESDPRVMAQKIAAAARRVRDLGFDSVTSYVWVHHVPLPRQVTDYNFVRDEYLKYWDQAEKMFSVPYFPNVTMGWDSSPRAAQEDEFGDFGYPFTKTIGGNTPDRFREALGLTKERLLAQPTGPRVFNINCWNEWTEGSYLEPDTVHGMKRGLFVSIAALWIRWGGQDKEGWRYQLTEDNARPYGRFLGQRYAARKNILWILGGDANPGEKQRAISLLAQGLKETAPHHLITVHNAPEHSSAAFFAGESWLDINAAYTYRETYGQVLSEWLRPYPNQRPRPIFLIESGYEKESNDQRPGDPFRVRRQAYGAILSGALMGHTYGHRELWRVSGQWRQGMDDVGSKQMRHVRDLIATRRWWLLEPDLDSRLEVGGRGKAGGVD